MIKLQIIGNLGKDCVVKEANGKKVINFNVAHTEKYKDAQGVEKETTTWVECAYWNEKTAVAQYLTKGKTVFAEGIPQTDAYANKDGQPIATLKMRVSNIQLLSNSNSEGAGVQQQPEKLEQEQEKEKKQQEHQQQESSSLRGNSVEKNNDDQITSSSKEINKLDVKEDTANGDDLPF